jgi:hypothetical protein
VSYDAAGTVAWVNEALKQTLHLPPETSGAATCQPVL